MGRRGGKPLLLQRFYRNDAAAGTEQSVEQPDQKAGQGGFDLIDDKRPPSIDNNL